MRRNIRLLLSVCLVFDSVGCFRVTAPEAPRESLRKFGPNPFLTNRQEACAFAVSSLKEGSSHKSPESIYLAAQCYEIGVPGAQDGFGKDVPKSRELYVLAAQCALPRAESKVAQLGLAVPEAGTAPGVYFWPYWRLRSEACGYEEEMTSIGKVSTVVALPIVVVGAVVGGIVLVVGSLVFCAANGVVNKERCM